MIMTNNEVNFMLVICFVLTCFMCLFLFSINTEIDQTKPYSRIEFIQYFQDSNTNICFATIKEKSFKREFITNVDCTEKVLKQITK